jgi:capsular exopolysaccharide synthesis family protein
MWFRWRHRLEPELALPGEASVPAIDAVGNTAVLPRASRVADEAREPARAQSAKDMPLRAAPQRGLHPVLSQPIELRSRYRQTKQFTPARPRLARHLVIAAGAPSAVHSAYNLVRTQMLRRLQDNGWNTVAITSPSRASGNTTTAINLAISIARDFSYTVLLVELDLVNPSFREIFGFEQREGIVDHLLHDVPIPQILLNPGIDRLVVIPAGSPVGNSSELLSSPKMIRLVEELKLRYEHRIVLFDLPSMLALDDAIAFSRFVDCALLVVEEGETRVNDVRRALDYLGPTNILGVVLNRSIHAENCGRIRSG